MTVSFGRPCTGKVTRSREVFLHRSELLLIVLWLPGQFKVTNTCLKSDFWSALIYFNYSHTRLCSFLANVFLQ